MAPGAKKARRLEAGGPSVPERLSPGLKWSGKRDGDTKSLKAGNDLVVPGHT